ncbi:MAG: hypothetical protein GON13_04055 [Nanoarchaeota archaeon]|nr:hypothetical protein [Nanoarchaeota archaeon]
MKFGVKEQLLNIYPAIPQGITNNEVNHDLWFGASINHTIKNQFPSEIYLEKAKKPGQEQFWKGVQNNSIGCNHEGAGQVGSFFIESYLPSFVVTAFTEGYFYNMQQTTRRGVKINNIICKEELLNTDGVKEDFNSKFQFYNEITREEKQGSFNKLIQGSMQQLPLCIESSFEGPITYRTLREYSRWRKLKHLPFEMKKFGQLIDEKLTNVSKFSNTKTMHEMGLEDVINGLRIDEDPSQFYADHTMHIPENMYFEKIWNSGEINELKKQGANAVLLHNYNPFNLTLDNILEGKINRNPALLAALPNSFVVIASKNNLASGIDENRHMTIKKVFQPFTHALKKGYTLAEPTELKDYKADVKSLNRSTDQLIQDLNGKIPVKELFQLLPHNFEAIKIETIDYNSLFNLFEKRDCVKVREGVYQRIQKIKQVLEPVFPEISKQRLAKGVQLGVCYEKVYDKKGCKACGKTVQYTH